MKIKSSLRAHSLNSVVKCIQLCSPTWLQKLYFWTGHLLLFAPPQFHIVSAKFIHMNTSIHWSFRMGQGFVCPTSGWLGLHAAAALLLHGQLSMSPFTAAPPGVGTGSGGGTWRSWCRQEGGGGGGHGKSGCWLGAYGPPVGQPWYVQSRKSQPTFCHFSNVEWAHSFLFLKKQKNPPKNQEL